MKKLAFAVVGAAALLPRGVQQQTTQDQVNNAELNQPAPSS